MHDQKHKRSFFHRICENITCMKFQIAKYYADSPSFLSSVDVRPDSTIFCSKYTHIFCDSVEFYE